MLSARISGWTYFIAVAGSVFVSGLQVW
jgi:hypothetical protein